MQHEVPTGGLMTTANVKHAADPYEYRPFHYEWHAPGISKFKGRTFNGYYRKNGRVGHSQIIGCSCQQCFVKTAIWM